MLMRAMSTMGRHDESQSTQWTVKGSAAVVVVATSTESLLRVQLGTDSLARVEAKLAQAASELATRLTLAESTDDEQMSQAVTA